MKPEDWLLAHMASGLDAVVVSDHQSGQWIDKLKTAYAALDLSKPQGFRPLAIFPGVEIAVFEGVHVLFVLDPSRTGSDITRLLGLAKYKGKDGDPSGRAESNLLDLLKELRNPDEMDCLAIPAHINAANGLLYEKEATPADASGGPVVAVKLDHAMRKKILEHEELIAVEVVPRSDMSKVDTELASIAGKQFARVFGSDSHAITAVGQRSTWVKMESANLAGLRLALLDGEDAVRPFDETVDLPERKRPFCVQRLWVENGKIIGRKGVDIPDFDLRFSPALNTIIGGRSAGKSSVVELMRQTARRAQELGNEQSPLRENFEALISFLDTGDNATPVRARLEYRLHGQDFVLDWRRIDGRDEWTLWERGADGKFQRSQQAVEAGRFPLRIFSQKQIYSFAKRASDLLSQIDAHPDVAGEKQRAEMAVLEQLYLQRLAERQTLHAALAEKPKFEAAQKDLLRQIEALQKSGHETILRETQLRRRQQGEVDRWTDSWRELPAQVEDLARRMEVADLTLTSDAAGVSAGDQQLIALARTTNAKLSELANALRDIGAEVAKTEGAWKAALETSAWRERVRQAEAAYQKLLADLQAGGVQGPEQFGKLLQERQLVERKLGELSQTEKRLREVDVELPKIWQQVRDKRSGISDAREKFVQSVFGQRQEFRVALLRYYPVDSETELRRILKRDDGKLERDFEILTEYLFPNKDTPLSASEFETRLYSLKETLCSRSQSSAAKVNLNLTQWFVNHLQTLNTEDWGRLWLWFPEDGLDLQYRGADGKMLRVQDSSPGQASAAILAFLLSFGDEPLILDQPEDDLDNRLIYDLIVRQLRENKKRRQIIVVTHNANIVVNGNSELIFAVEPKNGQSRVTAQGSLQRPEVREAICSIMEGGEEAFKRRFRRILEKD